MQLDGGGGGYGSGDNEDGANSPIFMPFLAQQPVQRSPRREGISPRGGGAGRTRRSLRGRSSRG
eukprot:2341438-Rhodomonas_salina.1